jgi:hypothetical protein
MIKKEKTCDKGSQNKHKTSSKQLTEPFSLEGVPNQSVINSSRS